MKKIIRSKVYLIVLLFLYFISCSKVTVPERMTDSELWKLKKKVAKGDKDAYYLLMIQFMQNSELLLPYALMMSDKYDYPTAMIDVYSCYIYMNDLYEPGAFSTNSLDSLSSESRNMALEYLFKAYQKSGYGTQYLAMYYRNGKYVEQNDSIADILEKSQESDSIHKKLPLVFIRK
jgi:hypothetical protein